MRTLVIGSPGVGKTHFTRQLQQVRACPVLHLDSLWHRTDYSPQAEGIFNKDVQYFMRSSEAWIVDGGYLSTLDLRLTFADQVIWLKSNPLLCLWRVLKRSIRFRFNPSTRPEMPLSFEERFDKDYLTFLRFVWAYSRENEPFLSQRLCAFTGEVVVLSSSRSVREFLANAKRG